MSSTSTKCRAADVGCKTRGQATTSAKRPARGTTSAGMRHVMRASARAEAGVILGRHPPGFGLLPRADEVLVADRVAAATVAVLLAVLAFRDTADGVTTVPAAGVQAV